jgi:hypothetical protein
VTSPPPEPRGDRWSRRFNLVRAIFWMVMMPVAYALRWIDSVAFVSVCSLYANAASDWAAYRADQNRDLLERLTRIEERQEEVLRRLEATG